MDGIKLAHYGEERTIDATDEEKRLFDLLCEMSGEEKLRFVRKSANYVSAILGPMDVARFKFTKKARWILFPYVRKEKVKLQEPDDVLDYKDDLLASVECAKNCR